LRPAVSCRNIITTNAAANASVANG
jgi:hypothetical protein